MRRTMRNGEDVGVDDPLGGLSDVVKSRDLYGLAPVAYHLARVIADLQGNGQVVAVNARWGGMKTSVVNLTRPLFVRDKDDTRLEDDSRVFDRYRPKRCEVKTFRSDLAKWRDLDVTFVPFNAWLESGNEAIALSILDTIADTLANKGTAKELVNRLMRHARRNPGQYVQGAIGLLNVGNLLMSGAKQTEAQFDLDIGKSVAGDVCGVIEKIKKHNRKLIVVIDDIDRMPPERVQALMVALWWVRDLPKVSFLLLFDRDQVIDALSRTMFGSADNSTSKAAARFLEKIVQYSFDVPQPTREQLLAALDGELALVGGSAFRGRDGERWGDDQRWIAIRTRLLAPLVNTPRAVKRLALASTLSWEMRNYIPIDFRDVVAIEAVRLFRPDLFNTVERLAARIERGDDVVSDWSSVDDDATILAVLLPAHYRHGTALFESKERVVQRRGFGDSSLMSHYLQGVPYETVSVLYNLEDFFYERYAPFRMTLIQAAEEERLFPLCVAVAERITEGRANGRTHGDLARQLRQAAESLDRGEPARAAIAESLIAEASMYG